MKMKKLVTVVLTLAMALSATVVSESQAIAATSGVVVKDTITFGKTVTDQYVKDSSSDVVVNYHPFKTGSAKKKYTLKFSTTDTKLRYAITTKKTVNDFEYNSEPDGIVSMYDGQLDWGKSGSNKLYDTKSNTNLKPNKTYYVAVYTRKSKLTADYSFTLTQQTIKKKKLKVSQAFKTKTISLSAIKKSNNNGTSYKIKLFKNKVSLPYKTKILQCPGSKEALLLDSTFEFYGEVVQLWSPKKGTYKFRLTSGGAPFYKNKVKLTYTVKIV